MRCDIDLPPMRSVPRGSADSGPCEPLDALEQLVEVERRALAQILGRARPGTPRPRARPRSRSMVRKSHSALSLEESRARPCSSLRTRWMRMPAQAAPSPLPGSATWRSSAIIRSSLIVAELNEISLRRLRISRAERGVPGRSTGLIGTMMVSLAPAFAHQGGQGRVARVAAVPIGLAVDLDRLEHGRQAGRGQHHVGRDLRVAEHAAAAGVDVGGGDEQLDRRSRQLARSRRCRPGSRAAGWCPPGLRS